MRTRRRRVPDSYVVTRSRPYLSSQQQPQDDGDDDEEEDAADKGSALGEDEA